jgi:hypothetical protein
LWVKDGGRDGPARNFKGLTKEEMGQRIREGVKAVIG